MGEVENRLQPYVDVVVGLVKSILLDLVGRDQAAYETFIEMLLGEIERLPVLDN